MNLERESAYWITLSHIPKWTSEVINNIIIRFYEKEKISITEFFQLNDYVLKEIYNLNNKQIADLKQAKSEIPNNAFLAESLLNQGFEIIPIISPEYSKTLKSNLGIKHCPPILYIKGNKEILKKNSVAIVGSRDASEKALEFTDNIAKLATRNNKVIVSGFARGVDRMALDSAIKYNGQSIIVLPQGIMTFDSGFKYYYKHIVSGNVLVLSTFYPNVPWSVKLAMARNPIIYGLANEIYVAESSEKGGTWAGVIDGLKKGRKIYIRKPDADEQNANDLLIKKGAIPVDFNGNELNSTYLDKALESPCAIKEDLPSYSIEERIREILKNRPYSLSEMRSELKIEWTDKKLANYLKKLDFLEVRKIKRKNVYYLKDDCNQQQLSLPM